MTLSFVSNADDERKTIIEDLIEEQIEVDGQKATIANGKIQLDGKEYTKEKLFRHASIYKQKLVITYKINETKLDERATEECKKLKEKLEKSEIYKNSDSKETLAASLKKFKKDRLFMDAKQLIAKKETDDFHLKYFKSCSSWGQNRSRTLDEYLDDLDAGARKKKFVGGLDALAIGGVVVIGVLLAWASACASFTFCGVEQQPLLNADGTVELDANGKAKTITVPSNIPLQILESQFMLVFIGAVIGPVLARVLKEKYDIDIESGQISMIMTDATKAVRMYQNNANRLRDKDGKIPDEYKSKLRDLAFDSIKTNYGTDKYRELLSNLGPQVFDKAIESAVKNGWIERYPLEKKQVEEIIKQSIDAFPQIVKWKDLDEEAKTDFIDGHVRRILSTLKVEGWALDQLNEMFDAEVNKRLLAAAIADYKNLFDNVDKKDQYLKYTTPALLAAAESLAKDSKSAGAFPSNPLTSKTE